MDSAGLRRSHPPDARFGMWRAPDGWALRRMDWLQSGAARGRLLFIGGRGDFIEKYLEMYRHWHGTGWAVTTFDWRGQGLSRGTLADANLRNFDIWIDDLDALIADWQSVDEGPCVAIAHSMGAHLLLRTLVERSPKLDAAVLVAPMIGVNSAPMPAWFAPWVAGAFALAAPDRLLRKAPTHGPVRQRHLTGASPERYEDETWWWEREPAFNVGTPSWGWLRASFRSAARAFTPAGLAKVRLPILIVASAIDRLVSAEAIERIAGLLPNAELKMYPDSAHEILREGDAIRLDAIGRIDAFLNEHAR